MQQYPNVLAIDVGEIMRQVQTIIEQVAKAVEFVFLFTLAGGLLVLQAAIAATQDERRFDAAILRTLGASRAQLTAAQIAEFLVLGSLAGLLAAAGATAIGYVLSDRVFQIPFAANPLVWLVRHRRRRARRDARRLARHARHDAAAAARRDPAARLRRPGGDAVVEVRDRRTPSRATHASIRSTSALSVSAQDVSTFSANSSSARVRPRLIAAIGLFSAAARSQNRYPE